MCGPKCVPTLLCCTLLLLSVSLLPGKSISEHKSQSLDASLPSRKLDSARIKQYCDAPVGEGEEGNIQVASFNDYTLERVVLTIRHGDRSAIHQIPQSIAAQKFSCAPTSTVKQIWDELPSHFQVVSTVNGEALGRQMTPFVKPNDDQECQTGQLTARGFEQHLNLGDHLRIAYESLLETVGSENLYVRSTDYTRTIGSVAALLTKMLPGQTNKLKIFVNPAEENEIMHGIGLKSSSKAVDGNGEKIIKGSCPEAVQLSQRQSEMWQRPNKTYHNLTKIFGKSVEQRAVTDIADAVYASSCHKFSVPCSVNGCISQKLADECMIEADKYYCMRFAGADGGAKATKLSMYPFLHEILQKLQGSEGGRNLKLAVFSGHDSVVAPVLSALGVYSGDLCRWPPYASRIAFELYQKSSDQQDTEPYVRVVYNGKVMSSLIGCPRDSTMCPLSSFAGGVHSLLNGMADLQSACRPVAVV